MNDEPESRTEAGPSVRLRAFGFDDVHPLWGGQSLSAKDHLPAEVCVVDVTHVERRFRLTLTREEWASVERLVSESGLLTAEMPLRDGIPDEGRPSITLVLASGETVVFAKWANDRVPAFDVVLERLGALADRSGG